MYTTDQIKETANACYKAGMLASNLAMGDRLIAAGARAAESERKLRQLIEACGRIENLLDEGRDMDAAVELRAAIDEARKP